MLSPASLADERDPRSGGSDGRRKLVLNESYVMAVGSMIGGGIFATLGLVVEIAGHPIAWLSQNQLSALLIAAGVAVALGRFWFTQLQGAKT